MEEARAKSWELSCQGSRNAGFSLTHVCAVMPALLDLRLYKSTPLCYTSALSLTSTPPGSLYRQLLEKEKKKVVLTSLKSDGYLPTATEASSTTDRR